MMNKKFALAFLVLLIAVASCSFTPNEKQFNSNDKDKLLIECITFLLERAHFDPKDINDRFSEEVFDDVLMDIDPTKRYFLASDIRELEPFKYQIDDQLMNTDIDFFDRVHTRLIKRMADAREYYREILDKPFDFEKEEAMDLDYAKVGYAANKRQLKEHWRKELKYNVLRVYDTKLRDKESEGVTLTEEVRAEAEAEARALTLTNLNEYFDIMEGFDREYYFGQYLITIVEQFDPHSFYFAPEDRERFDERISGKFEGIGARLQQNAEGAKVVEIIAGGPVWRDKKLEVGDQILKVGQVAEEPKDIAGMFISDAVKLIKGPKGTVVFLTVRRVDGTVEEVEVTRDVVEIEDSYAKSTLIGRDGKKYGLIQVPSFYIDFDDASGRNAATDVAKEIARLKAEGVEGIVLDLRDNPGGSLTAGVDMTGLFIESGPVVQVKSSDRRKQVEVDKDDRVQWDGPLVLMVNELSASASEIVAAAIQDYKRGVVLGSRQTFGKGSVQSIIPLENFVRSNQFGDLGAIKVTTSKYYRINGGSTQLEGVKSDVVVPDRYSYIDLGERSQENALKWDRISPADYNTWEGRFDLERVIERSQARVADNPQVKLIEENAQWIKEQQEETVVPLRLDAYRAEQATNKERSDYFRSLLDYDSRLEFSSLPYDQGLFTQDSVLRLKRDRWHKDLAKDVYVEEAVNVLSDLGTFTIGKAQENELAERVKG